MYITSYNVLVKNVFDLSNLSRTELWEFQIHLSLGRVGCEFISGQRTGLAVRIRRIILHGRYLGIESGTEGFRSDRSVASRKLVNTQLNYTIRRLMCKTMNLSEERRLTVVHYAYSRFTVARDVWKMSQSNALCSCSHVSRHYNNKNI